MTDPITIIPEPGRPGIFRELTTLHVGGEAADIWVALTSDDVVRMSTSAWESGTDWMLLAGGSNTVVADEGFDGSVILMRTTGINEVESGSPDVVRLRVQAGHSWDALVKHTVQRGYVGLEALSGIPGSAGAAPVQNIGAYGHELSEVLRSITFLDYETGAVSVVPAEELELGYRTSAIKQGRLGVVLSIDVELTRGKSAALSPSAPVLYGQLADSLGVSLGDRVSLAELRRSVLSLRQDKGMVLEEGNADSVSAGSFFTNPIVSEAFARELPSEAPRWPMQAEEEAVAVTPLADIAQGLPIRQVQLNPGPRHVKLSAAWLIENAGVSRGYSLPGSLAGISTKHTLAITNRGGATAEQVVQLARFVQQRVQAEFGVILQPEPHLIGLEL
ncbi:UDP-N-acetylmuramate dehydrogenase [Lysinibacter sp. HNR]|uniref:UDP-N-acetylmuramate dehydrogenase n=1 Tax=Lysinibacter sp. HNR TaxID=3031408 RepID=UPI002435376F|nr:UDP-N-acetylmuramate dehydrogenase [Lysinibacter sp. HNR]WGD37131.1 UDP-N-acetylmuramate dehydrogenase [Lysinibacter sp. HNR]